jgi:hypothetical protein
MAICGYKFIIEGYLYPDCETTSDVYVYSESMPPSKRCSEVYFPENVERLFLGNDKLHTVITDMSGNIVDTHDRIC